MRKFVVVLSALFVFPFLSPAQRCEAQDGNIALLQKLSDGFAEVAAKVKPGVVAIVSEKTVSVAVYDPFQGTPFEHFFGIPRGRMPRGERKFHQEGQGSGVIVLYKGDYYILTNNHVVKDAEDIQVELTDERHFEAGIVGTDSLSDLALLKIDAKDLTAVPFGDSDELRVGELVLAVGNPFGYEYSITSGIISALGRGRFGNEYGSFIQTDAAINPGNSGGALVNLRGELVGINTAIVTRSGGYQGIGFAIPVNLARNVMEQLIEHGEVRRGLLGAIISDLDPVTAEALGMKDTRGVLIQRVTKGGPADKAGIKGGDVVLAMDGEPVRNSTELRSRIGATPPGTRVELLVLRDGKKKRFEVKLGELTPEAFAETPSGRRQEAGRLGMEVQDLTPEIARQLGYEKEHGVVVAYVEGGSEAERRGLRRGDLIQEVNHRSIETVDDYEEALAKVGPGQAILMVVRRGDTVRYVGLRMPKD